MKPILLCLHGWGGTKESFTELRQALKGTDLTILTPDLPGFGSEPEPPRPWSVDDYADWVEQWLSKKLATCNVQPATIFLIGHSHGGRIAIVLAARQNKLTSNQQPATPRIAHLFLCAPAGIRHLRHLKRIVGLLLAKLGKFFLSIPGLRQLQPFGRKLLYRLVRVHDYERASPIMRATMIRVAAEDLRPVLPRVRVPTDIFWGTDDRMTPVADGVLIHERIPGSTLHTYPGVRHAVHRERARDIAVVIARTLDSLH